MRYEELMADLVFAAADIAGRGEECTFVNTMSGIYYDLAAGIPPDEAISRAYARALVKQANPEVVTPEVPLRSKNP